MMVIDLELRRRMTNAIVRHGRTGDGLVPLLQRDFTGQEIADNIDAARAAAAAILHEPIDITSLALNRALAWMIEVSPELAEAI